MADFTNKIVVKGIHDARLFYPLMIEIVDQIKCLDWPKKHSKLLWLGVFLFINTRNITAQITNDIFNNHIHALGGEENIKRVLSIEFSGKQINTILSKEILCKVFKRKPNLTRNECIDGVDTLYSCFDGIKYCFGYIPPREAIKRLSKMRSSIIVSRPIEGFINDYVDVAAKAILIELDTIDNKPCFKLFYHYDTLDRYFYIDAVDYLLYKQIDILTDNVKNILTYGNYTTINGIKFPMVIKSDSYIDNSIVFSYEYYYDNIWLNKSLKDELFICRE